MTTVEEDRAQSRIHGLLQMLRDAEADLRRSYARVLGVVADLAQENAGAATGFGNTARLLAIPAPSRKPSRPWPPPRAGSTLPR